MRSGSPTSCGQGVVVGFGLTDGYPDANLRHYRFMLEGLQETAATLARRGIPFVLRRGDPAEVALQLAAEASVVVCDKGYLRHQRSLAGTSGEGRRAAGRGGRGRGRGAGGTGLRQGRDRRPHAAAAHPAPARGVSAAAGGGAAQDQRASGPAKQDDLDPADVEGILGQLRIDRSVPAFIPLPGWHRPGAQEARSLPREPARRLRHRPQRARRPADLHAQPLPPFRPDLAGRGGPCRCCGAACRRRRPRLVPRGADRPPRALAQLRHLQPGLRQLRRPAALGQGDAGQAPPGPPRASLRHGRAGGRPDPRPLLQCRDARDAANRLHAQLHAHVLGQEDPRMVSHAPRKPTPIRCASTTDTSSAAATRIPTPTSPGSSASTTAPGWSARSSAKSAT